VPVTALEFWLSAFDFAKALFQPKNTPTMTALKTTMITTEAMPILAEVERASSSSSSSLLELLSDSESQLFTCLEITLRASVRVFGSVDLGALRS
jgi:hypothetical protein